MKRTAGRRASYATLDGLARVPLDDALEALGHDQHRTLLFGLLERDTLADAPIVLPASDVEAGPLDRLVETKNGHLPKLTEHGFIDWNRETRVVSRGPKFGEILPLLALLADHEEELPEGWLDRSVGGA